MRENTCCVIAEVRPICLLPNPHSGFHDTIMRLIVSLFDMIIVINRITEELVLLTSQITSMPARLLKKPVGSLSALRTEIVAAIDFAISGC